MLISADGGSWQPLARLPEPPLPAPVAAPTPTPQQPAADYRPDTTYHPQLGPSGTNGVQVAPQGSPSSCGPTGTPSPTEFSAGVRGPQAREFDVVLSQLATAVYENRPAPPAGWSAVTDQTLQDAGIADPGAWRAQYLHGGDELLAQNFHAEIYTDCSGNFVLAYRGTDGTGADWMNNGRQGVGLETQGDADKFSDLAADTAVEFERVFGAMGADGEATNLAITGHSQGGGLASAGALASGIPAVTFDASGLHPNTLERMGFTPEDARATAEGGLIRRYSLQADALTQLQESSPLALAAPDALGTQVVVQPSGVQDIGLIGRGLDIETGLPGPVAHGLGGLLEAADRLDVPLLGGVGSIARNLVSHSPELLTDAMVQQRPWEPGYVNPQDGGRDLVDLVPQTLQDDFARNTSDLVTDIIGVAQTDFAAGNAVLGTSRIVGDVAEGVATSVGDSVRTLADGAASRIDANVGGPVGDVLAGATSLLGRGSEAVIDGAGSLVEGAADVAGHVGQAVFDRWFG